MTTITPGDRPAHGGASAMARPEMFWSVSLTRTSAFLGYRCPGTVMLRRTPRAVTETWRGRFDCAAARSNWKRGESHSTARQQNRKVGRPPGRLQTKMITLAHGCHIQTRDITRDIVYLQEICSALFPQPGYITQVRVDHACSLVFMQSGVDAVLRIERPFALEHAPQQRMMVDP